MKINLRITFAMLGVSIFMTAYGGRGQNVPCQDARQKQQRLNRAVEQMAMQNAANRWRFVGVDLAKQTDSVNPKIRQARTAFWAQTLHDFAPVSGRSTNSGPPIGGACLLDAPEFYKSQGESWITGTFLSYKVFPIPAIHLAYTEIQFRILSVVSAAPSASLASDQVITLGIAGGTLLDKQGKPVSYYLRPDQYSLRPDHSYLTQMFFESDGGFYSGINGGWDITGGTAAPNDMCDAAKAEAGKSQIAGTPVAQIVSRMKTILAAR